MLFSVLIANYNNGHFFQDCYNSILEQSYENWEVIIVDDGSTDNSLYEIERLIEGDKRFKLFLNPKNKGCGFTKNRCALLATGEILGFLDPDDALYPNAIMEMINTYSNNPNAAVITSKFGVFNNNMTFINYGKHGETIPDGHSYLTYGRGALTHFAAFTKIAYLKIGGIDDTMKRAVDQDLYYKLEEQGAHVFLNKVLYKYRNHSNSLSQQENTLKAQYWHLYALTNAFNRRRKRYPSIKNITRKFKNDYCFQYYLQRFETVKFTNRISLKFYFLYKLIIIRPFYKLNFKFRSFISIILGRI